MTLLRGIAHALASIAATLITLVLLTFMFGVYFAYTDGIDEGMIFLKTNVTFDDGSDDGFPVFDFLTVDGAMTTLMLHGLFLDDISDFVKNLQQAKVHWINIAFFYIFVFLGAFTLLNMLVGFQVGISSGLIDDRTENERRLFLQRNLNSLLAAYDEGANEMMSREELTRMLQDPEVHELLEKVGTDIEQMSLLLEEMFEETGFEELHFTKIIDLVMQLKASHGAKVTDIVKLQKFMAKHLHELKSLYGIRHPSHTIYDAVKRSRISTGRVSSM